MGRDDWSMAGCIGAASRAPPKSIRPSPDRVGRLAILGLAPKTFNTKSNVQFHDTFHDTFHFLMKKKN